jgi:hypothetical protein
VVTYFKLLRRNSVDHRVQLLLSLIVTVVTIKCKNSINALQMVSACVKIVKLQVRGQ